MVQKGGAHEKKSCSLDGGADAAAEFTAGLCGAVDPGSIRTVPGVELLLYDNHSTSAEDGKRNKSWLVFAWRRNAELRGFIESGGWICMAARDNADGSKRWKKRICRKYVYNHTSALLS